MNKITKLKDLLPGDLIEHTDAGWEDSTIPGLVVSKDDQGVTIHYNTDILNNVQRFLYNQHSNITFTATRLPPST